MKKYGKQVGTIVYGHGINVRRYADNAKARGFIVIYDDGIARIHKSGHKKESLK